jgi:hypothetical protein
MYSVTAMEGRQPNALMHIASESGLSKRVIPSESTKFALLETAK